MNTLTSVHRNLHFRGEKGLNGAGKAKTQRKVLRNSKKNLVIALYSLMKCHVFSALLTKKKAKLHVIIFGYHYLQVRVNQTY